MVFQAFLLLCVMSSPPLVSSQCSFLASQSDASRLSPIFKFNSFFSKWVSVIGYDVPVVNFFAGVS